MMNDYQTLCLQFNNDQCIEYNPYFTSNLYWTEKEIKNWTSKYNDGLFNFDLLKSQINPEA